MTSILEKFRIWGEKANDLDYISRQGEFFAADTAVSPVDARRLVSARDDVRERMVEMAAHYGVGPARIDANRGVALDVALACADCGHVGECSRYLDGDDSLSADDFCPNAGRYREMNGQA